MNDPKDSETSELEELLARAVPKDLNPVSPEIQAALEDQSRRVLSLQAELAAAARLAPLPMPDVAVRAWTQTHLEDTQRALAPIAEQAARVEAMLRQADQMTIDREARVAANQQAIDSYLATRSAYAQSAAPFHSPEPSDALAERVAAVEAENAELRQRVKSVEDDQARGKIARENGLPHIGE